MEEKSPGPLKWHPSTWPPVTLRTRVPLVFFTQYMDATLHGPVPFSQSTAHSSAHSCDTQTKVAAVTSEPALAGFASSATTGHSKAAQLDTDDSDAASTSTSASFLGIPMELRYIIYGYLWAPNVDVYIDPPSFRLHNIVHPILHINSQIRSEAVDSIRRDQTVTVCIHANADDLDLRSTTSVLKKLDFNFLKKNDDRKIVLRAHIRSTHMAVSQPFLQAFSLPVPPGSFADFIACLTKLGWEAEYEFTRLDLGGPLPDSKYAQISRDSDEGRSIKLARAKLARTLCASIKTSAEGSTPDIARAMKAVDEMQIFVRGFCLNSLF
jgi:hypothetical protein